MSNTSQQFADISDNSSDSNSSVIKKVNKKTTTIDISEDLTGSEDMSSQNNEINEEIDSSGLVFPDVHCDSESDTEIE